MNINKNKNKRWYPYKTGLKRIKKDDYQKVLPLVYQNIKLYGLPLTNSETVFSILGLISSRNVVCVKGSYDRVEYILQEINIPHILIEPYEIIKTLNRLNEEDDKPIIMFCNSTCLPYSEESYKLISEGLKTGKIKTLVTTDWSLKTVYQKLCPDDIIINEPNNMRKLIVAKYCKNIYSPFIYQKDIAYIVNDYVFTWTRTVNSESQVFLKGDSHEFKNKDLGIFRQYIKDDKNSGKLVHFTTSFDLTYINEIAGLSSDVLAEFLCLDNNYINNFLKNNQSISTTRALFLSQTILRLYGLIVDTFNRNNLDPFPTIDYKFAYEFQNSQYNNLSSINNLDKTKLEILLTDILKRYISFYPNDMYFNEDILYSVVNNLIIKSNDISEELLEYIKMMYEYNSDISIRMLSICVHCNVFLPFCDQSRLRKFIEKELDLTVKDIIYLHYLTKKPYKKNVKKIIQRIFNHYWNNKFYPEDLESVSEYTNRKIKIPSKTLLKELIKGSHVKKYKNRAFKILNNINYHNALYQTNDNDELKLYKPKIYYKYYRPQKYIYVSLLRKTVDEILKKYYKQELTSTYILKNLDKIIYVSYKFKIVKKLVKWSLLSLPVTTTPIDYFDGIKSINELCDKNHWSLAKICSNNFVHENICINNNLKNDNIKINKSKCLKCLKNHRNVMCLPCRHIGICDKCSYDIGEDSRCSICDRQIEFAVEYTPNKIKNNKFVSYLHPNKVLSDDIMFYQPEIIKEYVNFLALLFEKQSNILLKYIKSSFHDNNSNNKTTIMYNISPAVNVIDPERKQLFMALSIINMLKYENMKVLLYNGNEIYESEYLSIFHLNYNDNKVVSKKLTTDKMIKYINKNDNLIIFTPFTTDYNTILEYRKKHNNDITLIDVLGDNREILPENINYINGYNLKTIDF